MSSTCNPYEALYRNEVPHHSSKPVLMCEAQQMAIHMSLIYNAFGTVLKDLVGLLGGLYKAGPADQANQKRKDGVNGGMDQMINRKQVEKVKQKQKGKQKVNEPDFNQYMIDISQKLTKNKTKQQKRKQSQFSLPNDFQPKSTVQRIEVVRGKKQRQLLNGYTCTMCADFYRALGQDYSDSNGTNKLCNDCSRHRSNLPPTVFNMDFSQEFGFDD